MSDIDKEINERTTFRISCQDENKTHWALFASYEYGFCDYWIACSKDRKTWTKLFTGLKVGAESRVSFTVQNGIASIVAVNPRPQLEHNPDFFGQEDEAPFRITPFTLGEDSIFTASLEALATDSDKDDLTDIAEQRLFTDPNDADSDRDGIKDGQDRNPLAMQPKILTQEQRLQQTAIGEYLTKHNARRLVIVQCSEQESQEFPDYKGIVLSLTRAQVDSFVQIYGYCVSILKADVQIEKTHGAVHFRSYRNPLDAFGWTAIYQRGNDGWKLVRITDRWMS